MASMSQRFRGDDAHDRATGLAAAKSAIRTAGLVVFPTDTVYGIACDAFNPMATGALRAAKGRPPGSALPVLVAAPATVDGLVWNLPEGGRELIRTFWPGGLTIVGRQQPSLMWDVDESDTVSVRMPLHPLALELLRQTGPLAVTGGNYSGMPLPRTCAEAEEQLGDSVAIYLDGGPVLSAESSTIVDVTGTVPRVLREGAVSIQALRGVCPDLEADED